MKFPDKKQYEEEKEKWREAGEPLRSKERIREIYDENCSPCEHFIKISRYIGQCDICTCFLRRAGTNLNKIAFATTRCPLPEPRWVEEVNKEVEKAEVSTEPETTKVQYIHRPQKPGGKGCGC